MTKMTMEEAMQPQNITLDISKLSTKELEQLQGILYNHGYMNESNECYRRIDYYEH